MKICFVSQEVAGVRGGGIGTYIAEAGKALTAAGHEVWLVIMHPGDDRRPAIDKLEGFHKAVIVGEEVPQDQKLDLFNGYPHYEHAFRVHETLQWLGEDFDYIEFADYDAEGYIALLEQDLFGTYGDAVMAITIHSPTWECFELDKQAHRADLRIREVCALEEAALRSAPFLNAPSSEYSQVVVDRLGLTQDRAIIRYPMELGSDVPAPPVPRESLEQLRILYYGRIEPRKGIDELLAAFAQMPELEIELIGGDVPYSPYGRSYREWLERRAPANVHFRGEMPRDELLGRIESADVCIFPSLLENFPNTCIEAMAAARVVIGSKNGGMSEMIEPGVSGFLVDGRSPEDIVRVIQGELRDALPRLDEIGRAAAKRIGELCDPAAYVTAIEARIEAARAERKPTPAIDTEAHLVSVVIPFYKDRATIDEAVDSALAQTHRNLEVLLVSDGSPLDDAEEILAAQQAKDPRVRILRKPNGGLSSARNFAIEQAEGEFLLFLDADNIARPDYARFAVHALQHRPEAGFVAPLVRFFEDESGQSQGIYNPMPFSKAAALTLNRFGDAGAFFRRSVFIDHDLRYDELLISYEDWALWMDLDRLGVKGVYVPRILYEYRVRAQSMVSEDGRPNHPALMGLLIQRHFTGVSQDARDILTTLFQIAGLSILDVMMSIPIVVADEPSESMAKVVEGSKDSIEANKKVNAKESEPEKVDSKPADAESVQPTPVAVASKPSNSVASVPNAAGNARPEDWPLRYVVVDEMSRVSRRIPGLNRALRSMIAGIAKIGGKGKA